MRCGHLFLKSPLFVIVSFYVKFFMNFSNISASHISWLRKGKRYKDFPSPSGESGGKVEGKPSYLKESLCITCLSSFEKCDRKKREGES